jgi:hypothetical protein
MKTHFAFGLIFGVLISSTALALYSLHQPNYEQIAREQSAEIARLKLENEVMKVDTANWIVEHSELKP